MARQVSQVSLWLGRDVTRLQKTIGEQLRQPLRILDIGLAARHLLDMFAVDQDHLEIPFQ